MLSITNRKNVNSFLEKVFGIFSKINLKKIYKYGTAGGSDMALDHPPPPPGYATDLPIYHP